jgi:hypothetical protein
MAGERGRVELLCPRIVSTDLNDLICKTITPIFTLTLPKPRQDILGLRHFW